MSEQYLRIAIQKSGRLHEKSMALLHECGIKLSNGTRKLKATASNFPLEILYLRDDDIPQYVEDRVADAGILGENVVAESGKKVEILKALGFSKCRLALAIPKEEVYSGLEYFQNRRIATSYPGILSRFLDHNGVKAGIEKISGSVEIAPGIGLADGICDIVSSGSTLFMNGLKEVETILKSEAVLIGNLNLSDRKNEILDKLIFRIRAVKSAESNKYILLNAPNSSVQSICNLIPGMKSPTVLPLVGEGWSSIHSVVKEDMFWEIIDQLKELGAQGILVVPIEKMIL